jgi:hypothetical protein
VGARCAGARLGCCAEICRGLGDPSTISFRFSRSVSIASSDVVMSPGADERDVDLGQAGASAHRRHEYLRRERERRTREKHPRAGGLILALHDEPSHDQRWAKGAKGEERVAISLAKWSLS